MRSTSPHIPTIVGEALEFSAPQERESYLQRVCGDDAQLRSRVDELLRDHARAGDFLEQPIVGPTLISMPIADASGMVIGSYKLLERIGLGGMGAVYMAQQTTPVKRKVALKIIKPGMDSKEVIARFEAERQALALMDHPNIAKVLDGGSTDQGRPYFVMELVRGVPITDYCREKQVGLDLRLKLFIDVCRAVQHAHQKGIIHRDLKPSNILVTLHDGVPVVKVIDFGVAKALNQDLTERTLFTHFSQMIGTPLYMAPEQAEMSGLDIDTRSDIYSLGVVLYELLTGTTPFDQETISKLGFEGFRKVLREQEPPRPSVRISTLKAENLSTLRDSRQLSTDDLTRKLKRELDWVVMKALEKDRERRYESVTALAADVQRYLNSEPVLACPPSLGYRISKFVRRNRARVASGISVLVAVLIISGLLLQGFWSSERQAAAAVQDIESSLASARTAIESRNLELADRKLVEGRTRLDLAASHREELEQQIALVQQEIEQAKTDEKTFTDFMTLARKVQDSLSYGGEDKRQAPIDALNVLNLYGVLDQKDWFNRVRKSYLRLEQQEQVRETAYETLLLLADSSVRWPEFLSEAAAQEGLKRLEAALTFHEPTKALYWIRKEIQHYLKNESAANADQALYDSTPAVTAWDWFLPGHTAGWRGDRKAAITAYENALRIQPDHYNSLFFLAERLAADKLYAEALGYQAACIALRPEHIWPYLNRAEAHLILGNQAAAESDYKAAINVAQDPLDEVNAKRYLLEFYYRTNQHDKRTIYARQLAVDSGAIVDRQVSRLGDDSTLAQKLISVLGSTLSDNEETEAAIVLLRRSLEIRKRKLGNNSPLTALSLNNLGLALLRESQINEAIPLFEEAVEVSRATNGANHSDTLTAMTVLSEAYRRAGRTDKAIQLLEQAREGIKSVRKETAIVIMINLGNAYVDGGRTDEAVVALSDALDRGRTVWQADDLRIFVVMKLLGEALIAQGNSDQAIPHLEEVLNYLRRSPGVKKEITQDSVLALASAYANANRADECRKLIIDQLKTIRDNNEGVSLADWEAAAASTLLKIEEYDEAEPLARHCLELRQSLVPDTWQFFSAQSLLGDVLMGRGKVDESEPLLLEAIAGLELQRAHLPLAAEENIVKTLNRLVTLYNTKNDPDQVAHWEERLTAEKAAKTKLD